MSRRLRNRPDKRAPLPTVPDWWRDSELTDEHLDAWAAEQSANDADPEGDAYWRDAIASANSGSEQINGSRA